MAGAENLRIVYAGTPDFAVAPLEAMVRQGFRPVAVFTQPDRRSGRGRKLQSSPVKRFALDAGIPVLQPDSLKEPGNSDEIARLKPDLMIVVAYGLILPRHVLEIPRLGCWNIHASLLPRWRGAAPIQRAIEAGDSESGVCIMQMDEGLDTGPVLMRRSCPITPDETGESLHDKLARLGSEALVSCLQAAADGQPPAATDQPSTGASYARKLEKDEARIDWSEPADRIERRVRAFNPWPVTWCMVGHERTRIWAARVADTPANAEPGQVLAATAGGIDVCCGQGALRLTELQRPGGRRMDANSYLNARELPDRLG